MASNDTTRLYVGIEIGTTCIRYAFKFKQSENILVNNNWGKESGYQSNKAPMCVLTDQHDNFVAFGFDAQQRYSLLDESDSDTDSDGSDDPDYNRFTSPKGILHLYEEFKMQLRGEQTHNKHINLKSYDGHECNAIRIFAMALRYIRDHLFNMMIAQFHEDVPRKDEAIWVITVPAIWSDSATTFMKECAVEAGLIKNFTSNKLLIALEPEAAAMYCRTLDLQDFQLEVNVPHNVLDRGLPKNSHYMVVDCGSGTVDVTAHHYKSNGDICELYAGSGEGLGGRNVDIRFEQKMNEVIHDDFIEILKSKYCKVYLDMQMRFEKEKRDIDFTKPNTSYNFRCPYVFDNICKDVCGKRLQETVKENQNQNAVAFRSGTLKFPQEVLYEIFAPPIHDIKTYVSNLLQTEELNQIRYIYLMGGFSDCSLLQKIFKKEFSSDLYHQRNLHVVFAPYDASLAVVKGAVLFGSNPQAISSRRARRFYCTCKPNSSTRGASRDNKRLVPIVTQNEEIYNDHFKVTTFYPYSEGNIFKLYHYKAEGHSKSNSFRYSNDKDVGLIKIDLSKIIGSRCTVDTKVSIYMYFESTEIHVIARNDADPDTKRVTQTINCLAH